MTALVVAVVIIALAFDYTNGFHDSANAIANSISTRALSPRLALLIAAIFNLLGALAFTGVASTVGKGIIDVTHDKQGLVVVMAALLGAITWNLITWYFGLPSSSSHALIGGLVGAALSAAHTVHWSGIVEKVIIPMVISPLIGFALAYLVMVAILWAFRKGRPHTVTRGFRGMQPLAAMFISFSHGTQDAQKTMGVITLALFSAGKIDKFEVPFWVKIAAAAAIAAGTFSGGMRIIRTLGRRIVKIDPPQGFAADLTASVVLLAATHFKAPVSTTHVITSSIMGVGATRSLTAVRWGVARSIVAAWVLTMPAAALVAALFYQLVRLVTNS